MSQKKEKDISQKILNRINDVNYLLIIIKIIK